MCIPSVIEGMVHAYSSIHMCVCVCVCVCMHTCVCVCLYNLYIYGTVSSKITLSNFPRQSKRKVTLTLKCMANYKFSA